MLAGATAVGVVEASWLLIEEPGTKPVTVRLCVDLSTGACRMERGSGDAAEVVREDTVEPDSIEVAAAERGFTAVTVPGVLMAVGMPGRNVGFARSAWVDALGPRAGCIELVGLRLA